MPEQGRYGVKSTGLPDATDLYGVRLPRLAYLLAAVVIALTIACGEARESMPADAISDTEQVVTLEQQPDSTTSQASSVSPTSVGQTGPRFATSFSTPAEPKERGQLKIATLLRRDAIPSIDSPKFIDVESANEQMDDDVLVIGVAIEGEHKAYSTAFLSSHEIVNDIVGGKPVAVTW